MPGVLQGNKRIGVQKGNNEIFSLAYSGNTLDQSGGSNMDQQDKKKQEALWTRKVMDLHQVIERALSRQWTLIDDRDCRDKSPVNRALKKVKQLNTLVNDGLIGSQHYQKNLKILMKYIEELALYDFVSEEVLQTFGSEAGVFSGEDTMASTFAWIQSQGINL